MEANSKNLVAPFVVKTYQMVNDPMTNSVVTWGKANNTFVVIDYLVFTQRILPVYFKHTNFSSFVRQLNTYGFRKVDPDRWEFANEWFLRGQKHLLKNIVRRKHNKTSYMMRQVKAEAVLLEDEEEIIVTEIARLKQEQKSLEEELRGMTKRLEATERRPQQMMAFLCKVVEDPDLLRRMMLENEHESLVNADKKRRLTAMPSSSSSSSSLAVSNTTNSVKSEEETGFDIDNNICSSSYHQTSPSLEDSKELLGHNNINRPFVAPPVMSGIVGYGGDWKGQMGYFGELVAEEMEARPPPSYPFSLLEGGF